jgi:K319-like protein
MNTVVQGQIGVQQQSPPVSNTNPEQTMSQGDRVTLTGASSFDPDGEIVSYAWGIEDSDDESQAIALDGQNTSIATFTAPKVEGNVDSNSYLFELKLPTMRN